MSGDPIDTDANRLSAEAYARDEPAGWFEPLYAAADRGRAIVPWDRDAPSVQVVEWLRGRDGTGVRAVVVGCGLGRDSEHVASLGFDTTAFDLSSTAVRMAKERHPGTRVRYETADLLDLPLTYSAAFDLVIESYTVQALPEPPRRAAIGAVATMVAPGGTLLVVAAARDATNSDGGPPFPLTREEIDAFATHDLQPVVVDRLVDATGTSRWRVEFRRSVSDPHAGTGSATG